MIKGEILGGRELIRRMMSAADIVTEECDAEMKALALDFVGRVKRFLRGPRPTRLGVDTGRLINSIAWSKGSGSPVNAISGDRTSVHAVVASRDHIVYRVGTNVNYGAYWENGFKRQVGAGARGGTKLTGRSLDRYIARHPPHLKFFAPRKFLLPALQGFEEIMERRMSAALKRATIRALKK